VAGQQAIYVLAYIWRRLMLRTTIIGITGSVGKTTTKEFLAAITANTGPTLRTAGNQNNPMGMLLTVLAIRPWHKYAVVEVGISSPGQMVRSAKLLQPDIGVVLSVAGTHVKNFKSLDATANEKAKLIEPLGTSKIALLNGDDPRVRAMASRTRAQVHLFGTTDDCRFKASNANSGWPDRLSFDFSSNGKTTHIRTQLVGKHWLNSVLAAVSAAQICGIESSAAAKSVEPVVAFQARMQPAKVPSGAVLIRDESTSSPTTLQAMLEEIQQTTANRRGFVSGDIADSKQNPKQRLRALGKFAAEHCDFAVFIGDHMHHAHKAATTNGMKADCCPYFYTVEEASNWVLANTGEGDVIFLKGRNADHLSRIYLRQFGEIGCDRDYCQLRRLCDVCPKLNPQFDLQRAILPTNEHENISAKKNAY